MNVKTKSRNLIQKSHGILACSNMGRNAFLLIKCNLYTVISTCETLLDCYFKKNAGVIKSMSSNRTFFLITQSMIDLYFHLQGAFNTSIFFIFFPWDAQ